VTGRGAGAGAGAGALGLEMGGRWVASGDTRRCTYSMAAEDRPLDAGRLVRDLVPAGRLAGMPRICLGRLPLQFHIRCAAERRQQNGTPSSAHQSHQG
jgi:hypothetical protein